jgi:S1-C subfamily serine protease
MNGRVVGISAISKTADGSAGSVGVGFAIPIEIAFKDAQRLLAASGDAAAASATR